MSTVDLDALAMRLAVVINTSSKAKPYNPDDNPVGHASLADLITSSSVLKQADLYPAGAKDGGWLGEASLNQVVIDGLEARKAKRKDARTKQARARAMRKQQIDAIADSPVIPPRERMAEAWSVIEPLIPIITRIADSKTSWASRYLGDVEDDVAQLAATRMALVLAKGKDDLDLLRVAAQQLAGQVERTNALPGNQVEDKDAKRERKAQARARKWLMGMANNRVMGALTDLYTERHNLRWENLDIIETVMSSINGAGDDPAFAHHNASKAPCFIASRMATPGSVHPDVLRVAIAAAITDRGLDRMCEILIAEDNVRTDGSFCWQANAEALFRSVKDGDMLWHAVCVATAHHHNGGRGPEHSRAIAARKFVQQQFEFLPWLVRSVVESCDAERVAWRDGRAIMASAFDPDGFAEDGSRKRPGCLVPTVMFADHREAARVLAAHVATVLAEYDA